MFASARSNANLHRQKRSRLIKEMAADLNRNEDSIASSTGSAHGTVSTDPTFTESIRQEESMHEIRPSPSITPLPMDVDDSESFGFHPGRDGAINSTGQWDISYTDMKRLARDQQHKEKMAKEKAKIPELRATAKKYGRWSPKPAQASYVIDVSAIDRAFPDFSGGIDSEDDLSRDLGRSYNRRPSKHISIDVPVYCDGTDHSDSRQVTNTGAQITNTAPIDIFQSIPLQNLSLNDIDHRKHRAQPATNVNASVKLSSTKTAKGVNMKHKSTTSRDTVEIELSQAPFDHFDVASLTGKDGPGLQDFGKSGNKENVMPQSARQQEARTGKPALRTSSNPRFQARVRDELDSSHIVSMSNDESPETQDISRDMSIVSERSEDARLIPSHSTHNDGRVPTESLVENDKRRHRTLSSELKSNKRKQPADLELPTRQARVVSNMSSGTVVHDTFSRHSSRWNARSTGPGRAIQEETASVYTSARVPNDHASAKRTSTLMSFVAPAHTSNPTHETHDLGLPFIKNGKVRNAGTPGRTNTSFAALEGFELPDDEEDIYQMCESQQVRIALLEEEREMQAERIRVFEQEMAAMKRQLVEFEAASKQKWQEHQCSEPKLQNQFNNLQATVAQVKHENGKLVQENQELRQAKRDHESHKCIDTELEMENAQLAADNERLEGLLQEWDSHQCKDGGLEHENNQLKANLEKYQSHVCRDKRLEREVRYLKDLKGSGSDVHLHITLKDARCRRRKE